MPNVKIYRLANNVKDTRSVRSLQVARVKKQQHFFNTNNNPPFYNFPRLSQRWDHFIFQIIMYVF